MTSAMAPTPQPHVLSAWITAFTGFDEAHGFAVNLFAVAALAVTGAVFLTGRPRLIRPVLIGFTVLCLADWVLIEDFGFLGGLGTDPNSMIPIALHRRRRIPRPGSRAVPAQTSRGGHGCQLPGPCRGWPDRAPAGGCAPVGRGRPASSLWPRSARSALIILGAAPMAAAQANPVADTILAQAIDGSSDSGQLPGARRSASPTSTAGPSRWPACAAR